MRFQYNKYLLFFHYNSADKNKNSVANITNGTWQTICTNGQPLFYSSSLRLTLN